MDASLTSPHAVALPVPRSEQTSSATARTWLLCGGVLAAAVAVALGDPRPLLQSDAELAQLLRGMALIKFMLVAAALGLLWWRLGRPLPRRLLAAYLIGAWVTVGAAALIWQLSLIVVAALLFHAGELLLLLTAWRDNRASA